MEYPWIEPLADVVKRAELTPVAWVRTSCRKCGEFRVATPRMPERHHACPRCSDSAPCTGLAWGGTRRPIAEPESAFMENLSPDFNFYPFRARKAGAE